MATESKDQNKAKYTSQDAKSGAGNALGANTSGAGKAAPYGKSRSVMMPSGR